MKTRKPWLAALVGLTALTLSLPTAAGPGGEGGAEEGPPKPRVINMDSLNYTRRGESWHVCAVEVDRP